MAEQLTFDLPLRPAMGRDDFYISDANAGAVAQIDGWRDWPTGKLVLCGATGSGKTHLAHVWAAQSSAQIVAMDRSGALLTKVRNVFGALNGALTRFGVIGVPIPFLAERKTKEVPPSAGAPFPEAG